MPTFHFNMLNQFVSTLIKESDRMTKSLKDVGGTVVKDLLPFVSEHALNAICGKSFYCMLHTERNFILDYSSK